MAILRPPCCRPSLNLLRRDSHQLECSGSRPQGDIQRQVPDVDDLSQALVRDGEGICVIVEVFPGTVGQPNGGSSQSHPAPATQTALRSDCTPDTPPRCLDTSDCR